VLRETIYEEELIYEKIDKNERKKHAELSKE
jgi:hypothetical protein